MVVNYGFGSRRLWVDKGPQEYRYIGSPIVGRLDRLHINLSPFRLHASVIENLLFTRCANCVANDCAGTRTSAELVQIPLAKDVVF